jgi:L-asparaginase II
MRSVGRGRTGTFEAARAEELVVSDRSGFVESRHLGSVVVLGPDGERILALGDPDALVLPRSTLKAFQAVASLGAGARLSTEQTALAAASHAGTPKHVKVVRGTLAAAGLDESALRCPPALPGDHPSRDAVLRGGGSPASIYMECSGKHAAMLAACTANQWATASYLHPQHPLQQHVKDVVERLSGEKVSHTAVDGCGAPVFAITLAGLARGVQRLITAAAESPFALYRAGSFVTRSVREHPWAIAGEGRPDTVLMERLGVYAKAGAGGMMTMATRDGTTVAVKVLDGSVPAARVAAVAALARAGAVPKPDANEVLATIGTAVLGGGRTVGWLRPTG